MGRESFEKRPQTRKGVISNMHISPGLRTDGVRQDYPVQDIETLGGCTTGGLNERETLSLAMQRVVGKLDASSNEAPVNLVNNEMEKERSGKRERSEGQGEPSEGAPEQGSGNPEEGRRGGDGVGDNVLDLRQQQQKKNREDEEGGGGQEGRGTITKDSSRDSCGLEGLRIALVRHGISRSRRQVFSRRAAEVGMEARDWPPTQVLMVLLTG